MSRAGEGGNPFVDLGRRFLPEIRAVRNRLLLSLGFGWIAIAAGLLAPWPLKWLIDSVLPGNGLPGPFAEWSSGRPALELAVWVAGLALVASTLFTLAGSAQKLVDAGTRERLAMAIRMDMLRHLSRLSPDTTGDHRTGELVSRLIADTGTFVRLFTKTAPALARHGATVLFTLGAMFWLAPALGLLGCIVVPTLAWLARSFAAGLAEAARQKRKNEGALSALSQEVVQGMTSLQASGGVVEAQARFERSASDALRSGVREVRVAVSMERSLQLAQGAVFAGVLVIGAALVVRGQTTVGSLTVFVAYVSQLLKPVEKINELAGALARGLASGERIVAVLEREVQVVDRPGALPIPRVALPVEFHNVQFRYPGMDRNVLEDVNFRIEPGELTVLTGTSGSGKTTIAHLIARLFEPDQGEIRIGGRRLHEIELESLHAHTAFLSQRGHFFAGTLREALCFGHDRQADASLWEALSRVELDTFVRQLPAQLDAALGEDGANLSGGQRRRLGLAQVLLCDRPLVILDEPTTGVDAESQRVILSTLVSLASDRTTLVISHRGGVREIADVILQLEGRRIRRYHAAHASRDLTG